jgi:fermentation-respiration switch protein FrsA (DUF1100 family)
LARNVDPGHNAARVPSAEDGFMLKQITVMGLTVLTLLGLSGVALARKHYAGGSLEAKDHGSEHGYRDGYQRGREDRYQRLDYQYQTEDYRTADRGYDTYMGEHDDFQDGNGYDDGYNGRAGRWNEFTVLRRSRNPIRKGGASRRTMTST